MGEEKTHKRLLAHIADDALRGFITLQCALRTRPSGFRIPLSLLRGFGSLMKFRKHSGQRQFSSKQYSCKTDISTTHIRLLKPGN
jgi:hypothetical protein